MSFDVQSFQEDVIAASHDRPVVVDFWAPWCGPCRVLGPIIEKLAHEQADRWTLVKVNSDQHQQEAARYNVRGIPAVKLFHRGEVIDEFTGALPEHAIRQWLDKALPGESKDLLNQAEQFVEIGDLDSAAPLLERVLELEAHQPDASGWLAAHLVFSNPERARFLADAAKTGEPLMAQLGQAVQNLASWLESDPIPEADSGAVEFNRALSQLKEANLEAGAQSLIEVLKVNRGLHDEAARKLGVALFVVLGPFHPVTQANRRTFDMWLT